MNKVPKIIIHNSISLDGSLTQFQPNMDLHYRIAGSYNPTLHLIGSNTLKVGIELYGDEVPPEEDNDFEKPKRDKNLPYWVIIDTKGKLQGLLHTCRRFDYCKDVIVLISKVTPSVYRKYLKERSYAYHIVGTNHVELNKMLRLLVDQYKVETILTDTGRILSNLLLNQGFVSEISLLVHPIIVGNKAYNIFSNVEKSVTFNLHKKTTLNKEYVWLVYTIK